MSVLDAISPLIARPILARGLKRQSNLACQFKLTGHPAGWIDGFMLADMTKTWHEAGLAARGLNYFTLGTSEKGLSSRFIAGHPYYQAWLGGYLVVLESNQTWQDQDYFALPEADQNKWLKHFGDPSAATHFSPPNATQSLSGYDHPVKLLHWRGTTHSDVGAQSRRLYTRGLMAGMASMMNQLNRNLHVQGDNFVPRHNSSLSSYSDVQLSGYLAIHDLAPQLKAVLYICEATGSIGAATMRQLITKNISIVTI